MVRVAVDAMGGDNAPGEMVEGALRAARERSDLKVLLVGREADIRKEIERRGGAPDNIEVIHADEVIDTGEPPVNAIRRKKNSSLVVGMKLVKDGQADAFCSAGNTGAVLVGGQVIVGRLKGVDRAPLAPLIPTEKGVALLIDCGANVDARPNHLVQFARIGSVYMKNIMGLDSPRVSLVNIGMEEEKGNALVKETYPLLKECSDFNFTGFIEARDIPRGAADVVVTEAFTGNVILKLYEGVGSALIHKVKTGMLRDLRSKIGALLVKPALKDTLKDFDVTQYGGAPLLGLKGLVVKTHGSAKAGEVRNTIIQCAEFVQKDITGRIRESLEAAAEPVPEQ
jgi:glycerol-3-phosphate acyltransferase PlsX